MNIKPIHTAADHKAALAEIERLWDAQPGTPDGDKFEVLATLVHAYERKHTPVLPPILSRRSSSASSNKGSPRKVLESIMGTRARVSEVLNGHRKLTLTMIRALNRELHIPLEILVRETVGKRGRPARRTRAE